MDQQETDLKQIFQKNESLINRLMLSQQHIDSDFLLSFWLSRMQREIGTNQITEVIFKDKEN